MAPTAQLQRLHHTHLHTDRHTFSCLPACLQPKLLQICEPSHYASSSTVIPTGTLPSSPPYLPPDASPPPLSPSVLAGGTPPNTPSVPSPSPLSPPGNALDASTAGDSGSSRHLLAADGWTTSSFGNTDESYLDSAGSYSAHMTSGQAMRSLLAAGSGASCPAGKQPIFPASIIIVSHKLLFYIACVRVMVGLIAFVLTLQRVSLSALISPW